MLADRELSPAAQEGVLCVPDEILDAVRNGSSSETLMQGSRSFEDGRCKLVFRALPLTCGETLPQVLVALLLRRSSSMAESINEVAADFRLTEREKEALNGLCMGLSSKELAKQMNIRPNTVKAFLRIIMVKMGVPTRAAVVAKILERHAGIGSDAPPLPQSAQRSASMRA